MLTSPAFGQADLTNCERELIHLGGSVQPHGVLLALQEPGYQIVQASANSPALLSREVQALLGSPVSELGGDIATRLQQLAQTSELLEPAPLRCSLVLRGQRHDFEGTVHRVGGQVLLVEIEPVATTDMVNIEARQLLDGTIAHRDLGRRPDQTGGRQ